MARYAAVATGNWSNTATWNTVGHSTAFVSGATADVTGTAIASDTFTAPNTTDAATGCIAWVTSFTQNSGMYTLTLEENVASVWTSRATGTFSAPASGVATTEFHRFMLTTPYTYTTTTANAYRYTLTRNTGSGLFRLQRGANSASVFGLLALDSRTAEPVNGDEVYIMGTNLGSTSCTVTVDGTRAVGSAGTSAISISPTLTLTYGIALCQGGILQHDTAGSSQLTVRGAFVNNYGTYQIGTESVALSSSYTAKLIFNQNAVSSNYGYTCLNGQTTLHGADPTAYATTFVSGVGTVANPLITAGDIGVVGDEVAFEPTGNYDQTERRFIITKNSSTSYVLSTTAGGAESALTYTHAAGSYIDNITRNITIEGESSSLLGFFCNTGGSTNNRAWLKNVRTNYIGGASVNKQGLMFGYSSGAANVDVAQLSGIAMVEPTTGYGFYMLSNRIAENEYNDNIVVGAANTAGFHMATKNKVMNRWHFYGQNGSAINWTAAYGNELNDFVIAGCANTTSTTRGALQLDGGGSNILNNLRINASRYRAINATSSNTDVVFNDCLFGTVLTNTLDITVTTDTLQTMLFDYCTLSSATLISNYENMVAGSRVSFQRYQQTDRRHRSYQPNMVIFSSGSGLSDTTADTTFDADSLAMKMSPISATVDGTFNFYMPQRAGTRINFFGKLRKTSDFNGAATINLYLEGDSVASDTYSLSGAADTWISFPTLSADYTSGTVDRLARVEILVNGTAGSVYLDTLFDAAKTTNPIGSMDLWQGGVPNTFLVSTVASATEIASSVWSDTNTYDAGSKGKDLKDASKAKLLV